MPIDNRIYELLVDTVRDYAVFVLDPVGKVATWNAGARHLKGYTAEQIIGTHFSIFYTPDAIRRRWPAHELKMATKEGRFEDEGWRVKRDGSRFWANVIITALRDESGVLLGFSKITRDLTARREAEEVLRQSEERFRLLIDGVTDYAIYMLDPVGIVSSWNMGAQTIKGYTRDEVIGKHVSQFYLPEDIASGKPWLDIATARSVGHLEEEGWRIRKNGERFWARVVLNTLYDAQGSLRGFAKVTQDLSVREQARDLERSTQHITEFIAVLAHELRNPLAPIRNALLVMDRAPPGGTAHREMRNIIGRQTAQLTRIVDDMIDVSRVARGTLSVNKTKIDILDVVARAIEIVAPEIERLRHVFTVDLPETALLTDGDADRLTQLVTNLLTNAIRFTPSGGRIALRAQAEGEQILVAVSDNGRGIAAADLQGIFGMFVQGKEAINRVGGGLGIGLALARRIAELHGGAIEVRSDGPGRGSVFMIRLSSLAADTEEAPKSLSLQSVAGLASKRVLIVDDNIDAARTLEMLLQSLGHQVCLAHDGPAALTRTDEFHPDIVLLDIGMPGMSGYDVARELRARNDLRIKIIAVTGWGTATDRLRSVEAGIDEHLVKPVAEAEILRIFAESSTTH